MKKTILISIFVVFAFLISNAQYTVSIKPGFNLNGASFGYQFSKFVPYVGFQYLGLSVSSTYETTHNHWDDSTYTDISTTNIKGSVFMPYVGLRYYFLDQYPLKAFANATFYKPILSGSYDYTYNGEPDHDDDFDDVVKSIGVYGGELSMGAEYFLDEHFSLSGEFGYRFAFFSYDFEYETNYEESYGNDYHAYKEELDVRLNHTYTAISLNFYFNKGEKKAVKE